MNSANNNMNAKDNEETVSASGMTEAQARELIKKFGCVVIAGPERISGHDISKAEGYLEGLADGRNEGKAEMNEKAKGLVEALKLKINALEYDIWFFQGCLKRGWYISGQKNLAEKALTEMTEAHKKCVEVLAKYEEKA